MKLKKSILIIVGILIISIIGGVIYFKSLKVDDSPENNPLANKTFESFAGTSIDDKKITNEFFKSNELTVVNIWGTFCPPCIKEMPEFEKVSKEYKDKKVKIVGVVSDNLKEEAIKVIQKTKVTYTNVLPNKELEEKIKSSFDYVPVTLFVNSEGKILETFIPGSTTYEGLKSKIDDILSGKLK